LYNDFVLVIKEIGMIVRRETINEIATLKYMGYPVWRMAQLLKIPAADIAAAIKTWKL